ncbi:hypothetical protein VC69_gp090 [Mycobacterium phage Inventum]|nr:hypothetical protein VC69_gp090 [Mycobacterium phage Inventum]YP_009954998.1 hypothetical protein I5H17_gp102 [Mycobacterium phage BodEinwohner17]YP_009958332.1 hypothetical protein I5H49_gp095 [Mycobacterium phage JoeyJr]QWY82585.1 hypothetical protein SEA_SASSAFRAS_94 [Mycobacterium phage Sassafras]QYC53913.1 hypothetical protein SEA_LEPERCHAUN_94 [Mycobacterium phage Leperchaun]WAB10370.1 hypothetical protein PBI_REDBIRD_93 [Mycobacterium phage RedBird]AIK67705.1 hypothetical protein PB
MLVWGRGSPRGTRSTPPPNTLKKCPIQDLDEYRAFCQLQADIYAHLADVPAEVGVGAAEWLERREKERREQEVMFRKAFEK